MEITMTGRTAIVTGGSKGLGYAIARKYAQCGANVLLAARDGDALAKARDEIAGATGAKVEFAACDVSTMAGVQELYDIAMGQFGQVDIVVNNAGMSRAGAFETMDDVAWQEDLDLKLFASIRLSRLVWPQMMERRWGRIINVLNTMAKAPTAKSMPTSVTRAAGMALTKALSAEGAPHNVLVNALLVGKIESDQWVRRAKASDTKLDDVYAALAKTIPMGRVGTADEFASAACFLASDWGSYITGTAINVDGGLSPVV